VLTQPPTLDAVEGAFGLTAKAPLRPRQPPSSALLGAVAAVLLARLVERPQPDRDGRRCPYSSTPSPGRNRRRSSTGSSGRYCVDSFSEWRPSEPIDRFRSVSAWSPISRAPSSNADRSARPDRNSLARWLLRIVEAVVP
jgi:hypothetical protein